MFTIAVPALPKTLVRAAELLRRAPHSDDAERRGPLSRVTRSAARRQATYRGPWAADPETAEDLALAASGLSPDEVERVDMRYTDGRFRALLHRAAS
jgi:hypothetical protein